MVSAAEAAAHLDLSRVAFSKLMARGVVKKPDGRAAFDLGEVRIAYIRHLRKIASGRAGGPDADRLTSERVLWTAAKRRREEMAEQVALSNFVSTRAVVLVLSGFVAQVREKLLGLPFRAAPNLVGRDVDEIGALLVGEVHEALDDLAAARIGADIVAHDRDSGRHLVRTNGGDDGVGLDA